MSIKQKGRDETLPFLRGRNEQPLRHALGGTAPLTFFAPKRPFGTFRCCAWLIFRQSPTGALTPKRACFSRGAAYEGGAKKPLRRCGASSPYTGEPRKRRNLSLPCVRGAGSAKPRRRGCVLPPRSFLLLAQSLQAVALQESGALGVAEDGIRLGVLEAVQFDHEAGAGTVKIHDAGTQHLLAVKADGIRPQKIIPKAAIPLLPKAGNVISAAFCRSGGRRRSPPRRARRNRGSSPRQRRRPRGRRNPQRPHGARRSGG